MNFEKILIHAAIWLAFISIIFFRSRNEKKETASNKQPTLKKLNSEIVEFILIIFLIIFMGESREKPFLKDMVILAFQLMLLTAILKMRRNGKF